MKRVEITQNKQSSPFPTTCSTLYQTVVPDVTMACIEMFKVENHKRILTILDNSAAHNFENV